MSLKTFSIGVFILFFTIVSLPLLAQNKTDYSNIHVDELSDDQITAFIAEFQAKGLNEGQIDEAAQAGGMSAVELKKLHARVNGMKGFATQNQSAGRQLNSIQDTTKKQIDVKSAAQKAFAELKSKIFGADFFQNDISTLAPNLNMATPANYPIGPNDQIIINVYGNSLKDWELTVSPEGTINIPGVGILNLNGKTVEQATSLIKARLIANNYTIGRGTNLQVSLGNIRTIQVTLIGEVVKPRTYPLPSFARTFNALLASGGPTENGSFRQIEVKRDGKTIATMDIYKLILDGDLKGNVTLQDQDIILIPTNKIQVEVVGQVKHPAIFEMLPGEKLSDLLQFAGGFTNQAYRSLISVTKNTEKEKRIEEIAPNDFNSYSPSPGDKYNIGKIIDRYENMVKIQGAVFREGAYPLTPGLTVAQLIRKAEGLREDAFLSRGQIMRLKDDLQPGLEPFFDIAGILAGRVPDVPLKREDVVIISSVSHLKEEFTVRVEGEVQHPNTFKFAEGMTLEDVIVMAGNLKESASSQRIDIARRVKNSNALSTSAQTAEMATLSVDKDLKKAATEFILQPFDIITVRTSAGYEIQKQVQVTGEVISPGPYTIAKKDERISDFIKRAGGFTAFAYPEGASLMRLGYNTNDSVQVKKRLEDQRKKRLERLQKVAGDSSKNANIDVEEEAKNNNVGIDLPSILKNPGGIEDIFLEEGDILNIPKQLQTVKVSGQVLSPNTVVFIKGKGFKQYVSSAGGFSQNALKRNSYIIYANGSVKSTHKILFFNDYPSVNPGSEVFVPQKADKKKISAAELLGLTTGIASLAAIIISLLRL